jgi:hypothetical protein
MLVRFGTLNPFLPHPTWGYHGGHNALSRFPPRLDSSVEAPLAVFSLKGFAIAVDNLSNSRPSFPLTGRPPIDGKRDG